MNHDHKTLKLPAVAIIKIICKRAFLPGVSCMPRWTFVKTKFRIFSATMETATNIKGEKRSSSDPARSGTSYSSVVICYCFIM